MIVQENKNPYSKNVMKLTLPQQDVYFEQLLYPNDAIYNIGAKILIEGPLEVKVLQKAYQFLIRQHDTYRTVFNNEGVEISASVIADLKEDLPFMDFSSAEHADKKANVFMQEEFTKPFNITSGRHLHRFILIKVAIEKYYLFSVYHHIITDGWGTSLMFQRLVKNYNELRENNKIISQYPYSYKDFIDDDEAYKSSASFLKDKEYWLQRFNKLPENVFKKINLTQKKNKSKRKTFYIKREQYDEINFTAKKYRVSTFHFILAVLFIYFGRKHQKKDMAIGLPVLNRGKSIFKKTVGLFMGISPLRVQIDVNSKFEELLSMIRSQLREDYRHQRFPLGKLMQELNTFNEKERLFNISLSYEKQNYSAHFENTKTTVIPLSHQSERVALAVYIREFDEKEDVKIDFDYNLSYFNEDQISKVTSHFQLLLKDILKDPDRSLLEFDYLSEKERHQLLYTFNDTKRKYPIAKTFLDLFKEKVSQHYNKQAIQDENIQLSYSELHKISDTIARNILESNEKGAIGILMGRSVYTITVLLGILKAGRYYIPLDPTFPGNRLQYIIDHSQLKTIISDRKEAFSFKNCRLISLEMITKDNFKGEKKPLPKIRPENTAYIIYTSGSTGNPKGVEVGHHSLLNFLLSICERPSIKQEDLLFAVTTYSFDISILEFCAPLISGASIYIASNKTLKDHSKIIKELEEVTPTIIQATPSFFQLLINGGWKGSEGVKIFCGGDLLSEDLAEQLLLSCSELWNMYGPTETTIWSSVKRIKDLKESSNIGSPIANTQLFVLDKYLQFLPVGSSGTLYIGGKGLAKGYYRDDELTATKFISNPHGEGKIFNTNDLVQWNEKGELIFLGRNDNQVKIRGFRIELGEIEDKFNQIPQIRKAVVVARKQQRQDAFLVAYIQKKDRKYDVKTSSSFLKKELPEYMIPYVMKEIDEFPLTPNKKIDRKKLAEKEIHINADFDELPQTVLQKELALLWKEVLNYQGELTLRNNFFSLGGHSLSAVKLAYKINERYNCNIGLKTIFDYPTLISLSNFLKEIKQEEFVTIPKAAQKEFYHITPSQYQLWVASQTTERSIAYNMVAAFEVEGVIYPHKMEKAVMELISKNEILRTSFVEKEGQVYQKIKPVQDVKFSLSLAQVDKDRVRHYIEKYINTPFRLEEDLLLRMLLIQTGSNSSILVFCTHHIIIDGISIEFFANKFIENYQTGESIEQFSEIQFKDYSEWQYNMDVNRSTYFYKDLLKDYQSKESISYDKLLSDKDVYIGDHYSISFSKELTSLLKQFAEKYESTPFTVMVSLLNMVIHTIEGHKDIVIGIIHSGRNIGSIASMIGMFVKTLPLRTRFNADISFLKLVNQVQKQLLLLKEHQDLPSSEIERDLFDILVTYQNPEFSYRKEIVMGETKLKYLSVSTNYNRIPLLFNFFEVEGVLNLTVSYNTNKYEKSTLVFFVELFKELLDYAIQQPASKLSTLKTYVYENKEQEKLDLDFNF